MKRFFTSFYLMLTIFGFSSALIPLKTEAASAGTQTVHLSKGAAKRIDLDEAPRSIEVTRPQIIEIERIGTSNAINVVAKRPGTSLILVKFPNGTEAIYQIFVDSSKPSLPINPTLPVSTGMNFVREIKRYANLDATVEDGKVVVSGVVSSMDAFRFIVKTLSSRPQNFVPAFQLDSSIEYSAYQVLTDIVRSFGEPKLAITGKNGVHVLNGIVTSEEGRERARLFVESILPGVVDATEAGSGDSRLLEVSLQFVEVGKGDMTRFGFHLPGMGAPVSGTISFEKNSLQPNFMVGTLSGWMSALREKNFARELAKPVVVTRSGEKASFLAGGEIPLSSTVANGSQTQQDIFYKPYGIMFGTTPRVYGDGSIWLDINIEVSSVDDSLNVNGFPAFMSRKISTTIVLREGTVALLTGLVKSSDAKAVQKIPVLGSIPILGEFFKNRRLKDQDTELWVAVSAKQIAVGVEAEPMKKYESAGEETRGSLLD